MYKNYGKIYSLCNDDKRVEVNSEKFVEPTFQSYLDTTQLENKENCNNFENDLFIYGRKEHLSGYRYSPLYERDNDPQKQLKFLKAPKVYDETEETKGCKTCSSSKEKYAPKKRGCPRGCPYGCPRGCPYCGFNYNLN